MCIAMQSWTFGFTCRMKTALRIGRWLLLGIVIICAGPADVRAIDLPLTQNDMKRAVAVARWPHSDIERSQFHNAARATSKNRAARQNCMSMAIIASIMVAMADKVSTIEVRQRIGDMLNRVALRHDEFIIERKGKPLAALVPVERLEQMRRFARRHALDVMEQQKGGALTDDQAMELGLEAQSWARRQQHKARRKAK